MLATETRRYALARRPIVAAGSRPRVAARVVTTTELGTLPDYTRGLLTLTARPRTFARWFRSADPTARYAVGSAAYDAWHRSHHGTPEDGCDAWHDRGTGPVR